MHEEQLKYNLQKIKKEELDNFIEEQYLKFTLLEGRCFKIKTPDPNNTNHYIYVKIQKIIKSSIYKSGDLIIAKFNGWSFEINTSNININLDYVGYFRGAFNSIEISNEEFQREWEQLIFKLSTFK